MVKVDFQVKIYKVKLLILELTHVMMWLMVLVHEYGDKRGGGTCFIWAGLG